MLSDDLPSPRFIAPVRTRAEATRFQRVKISVLGRYMLADRREFPCQVLEMSPGDAMVVAPVAGLVLARIWRGNLRRFARRFAPVRTER